MELAIKATCAETIQFSLLHELSPFCVIKILTRPVALRPAVGPTLNVSRTVLIWPSRPQSSHIRSTLTVAQPTFTRARQLEPCWVTDGPAVTSGAESEPNSLSKTSCKRSLETAAASSICRASSFAATSVARSGPLNVLPSFLRRARQPLASFCTAIAARNKSKLTVTSWTCSICGGSTILCNVCFGGLFPRWAKVTKAE